MQAYYAARAAEYDDWYLRAGATRAGPVHDLAWNAELDAATLLARQPAARRRDRRAGRRHRLVVDACWPARASCRSTTPVEAPLDRARERLVAHGLRAHLHVRDAWAEPDRAVDALFCGFWLSHVPRARLAEFLAHRPALAQARRHVRVHRLAPRPAVGRGRPADRRPKPRSAAGAWPTAGSSTWSRSTGSRPSSRLRSALPASSRPAVTTTARFFLLGQASA